MQVLRPTHPNAGYCLRHLTVRLAVAMCVGLFLAIPTAHAYLRPHIRTTLNLRQPGTTLSFGSEQLQGPESLRELYLERQYQPIWVEDGSFTPAFHVGLQSLQKAGRHGLDPAEYHTARLLELVEHLGPETRSREWAEAELLLSDGLVRYGKHLSNGRIDPSQLHPAWVPKKPAADVVAAVLALAEQGDSDAFERRLAPRRGAYWQTLEAAREWGAQVPSGGWPPYPVEHTLHPGDRDPAVVALRHRLCKTGEAAAPEDADPHLYDTDLEEEVKEFQRLHGLEADGVVGPATRAELQVTIRERHQQLLLTLERLRWLPHRWPGRTLVVNIADYALEAWQDNEPVLEMRVIVGSAGAKTPIIHQRLERVEINPYWKVPHSITVYELLPKIQEDCRYLEENGFELVSSYADTADVLDPAAIDWGNVDRRSFPGRLRQCPGPDNALGRVKFLFPNNLDVYLHDTPRRHLFAREQRSLSHGCVRVQQPITLADYVLQDHPEWPGERVDQVIASGERHVVDLHTPSEVYLLYWTAWADAEGNPQFRHDIYGRDAALLALLAGDSESPRTASLDPPPPARGQGPTVLR